MSGIAGKGDIMTALWLAPPACCHAGKAGQSVPGSAFAPVARRTSQEKAIKACAECAGRV
ncbi:MAG: hypothetical protein KGJ57_10315 [Sphingomonadales bacterium]|nr:hypothetical protein [Sphingomonadales bacterium]MDE2169806.1 hypothetical protein [Sphingomonadales bacterium]